MDESAAKKSKKWKQKRIKKKNNKNKSKSSSSSGSSDKSGSDEDVILISQDSGKAANTSNKTQYSIFDISISEDSEDAANADSTQNQEEQLSDDHDNEAKNVVKDSTDEESNESVMAYLTLKMIVEMMAMKTDCQIMIL